MYADSHQFVTSRVFSPGQLANPGIDKKGGYSTCVYLGGLGACCRKIFEIFVPREIEFLVQSEALMQD